MLVFQNFYPEGKQGGIEIIQHGERIATNGDLRLEPTPGQWGELPKVVKREVDAETNLVKVSLSYSKYNLDYVEDPLEQEDFSGFAQLKGRAVRIRPTCIIVGDDLTVTNKDRIIILELAQQSRIEAVIFKDQNLSLEEGDEIEITGRTDEYKEKQQIIVEKIRFIK